MNVESPGSPPLSPLEVGEEKNKPLPDDRANAPLGPRTELTPRPFLSRHTILLLLLLALQIRNAFLHPLGRGCAF